MKLRYNLMFISTFLATRGLVANAIALEVDDVATLPAFQQSWYAKDTASGKFKLDPSKVEVEDVGGLKASLASVREEARKTTMIAERKLADLQKQFEGIDPVKTKELLSKFSNEEEAALIAAGKVDQVIEKRTEKLRTEMARQLEEEKGKAQKATDRATAYMTRVLDNEIRSAVTGKVHEFALKSGDVLRAAREIFQLDENGHAIQCDKDGNVVLGKDAKKPFSPEEWIESMRTIAPHWFPAKGSGGDAPGSGPKPGGADYSNLSPQERMTKARSQNS